MAKHWETYKSEIKKLYITDGRPLDDVRRILKGRHNFDASIRAYRMKLEEWGMKKNKISISLGKRIRLNGTPKTTARTHLELGAGSSNAAQYEDRNERSLTSGSILQLHNHEAWTTPRVNSPTSLGQNFNNSSLAVSGSFHDNSIRQYVSTAHEVNFTSHRSLFDAISNGAEEEVTNLLSAGTSVNIRDHLNSSPLHAAVLKKRTGIVKDLLKYGADVDATDFQGKTPLHLAITSNEILQVLLRHQPTLSIQDDEGNTILHSLLRIYDWWKHPEGQDIPKILKSILCSGADINIRNRSGDSPLHRMLLDIPNQNPEYMEVLLEFLKCQPDVTTPMCNGSSLLAVFLDSSDILSKDNITYTTSYARLGFQCLEQFLVAGTDPNMIFHSQPLILYWLKNGIFRENGPSEVAILRLLEKADINVTDSSGNYPLHLALSLSHVGWGSSDWDFSNISITARLVARGVDINQKNAAGKSPLEFWLSQRSYRRRQAFKRVTQLFIEAGANTTTSTSSGGTLFDLLTHHARDDQIHLCRILLRADIDSQPDDPVVSSGIKRVEAWRSTWKQSLWHLAKAGLIALEKITSRPNIKDFMSCGFVVVTEHLLERHRSQLQLWLRGELEKEMVKENFKEYCAILRDCLERKAEVDPSWYMFLLDIMDFI